MSATIANTGAGKYGHGLFPFGVCKIPDCPEPACFRIDIKGVETLVCLDHKPEHIIFTPFLGAGEDFYSRTERWLLAGGGAGGGKTFPGSRYWLKQYAVELERWKRGEIKRSKGHCIFFRRTIPELLQVVDDFKDYMRQIDPKVDWNEKKQLATFPCGYKVQFAGLETDDSWRKFYGPAYTLIVFDEATTFTRDQIEQLDARLRCADPVLGKMLQLVLLTNPVGFGLNTKAWLKRRFINPAPPNTPVKTTIKLRDGRKITNWQIYCPFNLYDNPALMRDGQYEANLLGKSLVMQRALLDNDWDIEDGAWADPDWDPAFHLVDPFVIPESWFCFKQGDYGYSTRSSINWIAVDPDGNKVLYRHLSTRGMTVEELAYMIQKIESQPLIIHGLRVKGPEWDQLNGMTTVRGPMDPSLWNNDPKAGPSPGEILARMGTGFFAGDRSTQSAAEAVRSHLKRRTHYADGTIIAGLRIFTSAFARLPTGDGDYEEVGPVVTIPTCPVDPSNPDVWHNTSQLNHDLDSIGYGLLSRPMHGADSVPMTDKEARILDMIKIRDSGGKNKAKFPSWSSHDA